MRFFIYTCLLMYIGFSVFEAPIRYGMNLLGADSLIFIRDIVLFVPVFLLVIIKLSQRIISPALYIYFFIIMLHGTISFLNIESFFVVSYSAKVLFSVLAGVMLFDYLIKPIPKIFMWIIFIMWLLTFATVLADKYYIEFPWSALSTNIDGIEVDISKNWTVTGEDKRAGGMMRSSINVAIIQPLLAMLLLFNLKNRLVKLIISIITLFTLYWTTQKAAIVAFLVVFLILMLSVKSLIFRANALKFVISISLLMMIFFPIILPFYKMPNEKATAFSLGSFYMRIEETWPKSWLWIEKNELFPFGVGLGGIGGAQRFYAPYSLVPADNMFVFLYASFGIFSIFYLFYVWFLCVRRYSKYFEKEECFSLCILLFLFLYGCALSIIEDQIASLFLGAAIGYLAIKKKTASALADQAAVTKT